MLEWVATPSSGGSNRPMLIFQYAPLQTPTQFLKSKITAGRNHQKHLIFIPSPFSTSPWGCQWCTAINYTLSSKQVHKAEPSVTQHLASQCDKWILICLILKSEPLCIPGEDAPPTPFGPRERPGWPRSPPPGVGLRGWGRRLGGGGCSAELRFLTFAAAKLLGGFWRWGTRPATTARAAGRGGKRTTSRQVPRGTDGASETHLSLPLLAGFRGRPRTLSREIPPLPSGLSPSALGLLDLRALG